MLSTETRADYQNLLHAQSLKRDDTVAITFVATDADPIEVTRRQLRTQAEHFARLLIKQGIKADDLVIIAHPDTLLSIYAFWGALLIGAIPSLFPTLTEKLDPDIYFNHLRKLVNLSDVRAIITTETFSNMLTDMPCSIIIEQMARDTSALATFSPDPNKVAFLQHSSGTTGLQKGVALSHHAVLNQLVAYSDVLKLSETDVIVSWLPLYHDMGLIAGFLLPVVQGIPLVLMSPFDWIAHPALLLQMIDQYDGTLCWLPNFAYNHMAQRIRKRDREGLSLASMRAFINCSEPVHGDSHHLFLEKFAHTEITATQLTVSYAMAENTFAVTQTPIGQALIIDKVNQETLAKQQLAHPDALGVPIVSCGYPIQNTKIRIVDADNNVLVERYVGDIQVHSDCMLTEYYKRPDLQPFVDGWYQTGDRGYIADGQLYVIGRKKDIIITAGKNVYPQDIEAVVNTVEGVHQGRCVVFGVMDEREGTERIAVVVERDVDAPIDNRLLKKHIRQQISRQTTVSATYITIVDAKWLIKTSSGKIARAANREKWLKHISLS